MFNLLRSKQDRAAEAITAFVNDMTGGRRPIPAAALTDAYCVGFLRMVGVHVASTILPKGRGIDVAEAAFLLALTQFAPRQARDVSEVLPFLRSDPAFVSGSMDGDLYMGWKLLRIASERDGSAALIRFFERARSVQTTSQSLGLRENGDAAPSRPQAPRPIGWELSGGGHEFRLSRSYTWPHKLTPGQDANLQIICTVKSSPEVNFVISDLRFYFRPVRPRSASLVLGLFTDQPRGGLVEVNATVLSKEYSGVSDEAMLVPHRDDVAKLLRALTSAHELQFGLMSPTAADQEPFLGVNPEVLAGSLLPNDGVFKSLYEKACEEVAACQDATRARQLAEGWYRRRTPGLYGGDKPLG